MPADIKARITPRQAEILRLIVRGHDAKSIAGELGLSVHTVNEHLREARRSLNVTSSRAAARLLSEAEALPNSSGHEQIGVRPLTNEPHFRTPRRIVTPAFAGVLIVTVFALIAFVMVQDVPLSSRPNSQPTQSAPAVSDSASNGNFLQDERQVPPFDRITVTGPFKISIYVDHSETRRLLVLGPSKMLADLETSVESQTLAIRYKNGANWNWDPGAGVNVVIINPMLSDLKNFGSAMIEVDAQPGRGRWGEHFRVSNDGSGPLTVSSVDAPKVSAMTSGAGSITIAGRASELDLSVLGAGSVNAKGLRTSRARIVIAGAGSATADVTEEALISRSGNGRVEVVGGAKCIKSPPTAARVECR